MGANSLSLAPLAPVISESLGIGSLAKTLLVTAGFGLGTAVSSLTLAPYVDRFGAAPLLRVALGVLFLCFVASALAPGLWFLIAVQTIAGLAAGVGFPATYGLGADISPKGEEARTMGLILTGWTLSLVAGVTVATIIADYINWRILFASFAALTLILAIILSRMPVPTWHPQPITRPWRALQIPGFGRSVMVAMAFMLAFYGSYPFLAPHVVETLGLPSSATAIPVLAYGVGFGASSIVDRALDRKGYNGAGAIVFGLAVFTLTALSYAAFSFVAVSLLMGLYGIINHAGLTLILNRLIATDPARKGAILGIYSCLTYVSVTIGATGFAPIYAYGGFSAVTLASAGCAALMLVEVIWKIKNDRSGASHLPDH